MNIPERTPFWSPASANEEENPDVKISNVAWFFDSVGNEFEIELVEMGKSAVPATNRDVPCPDREIVGTGNVAVPAISRFDEIPDRVFPNLRECTGLDDIFNPGDEDPGRPAVIAYHLRSVRHRSDVLIRILPAVIAIGPVPGINEVLVHA